MKTPNPDAGLPTADDVRGIIPRSTPSASAGPQAEAVEFRYQQTFDAIAAATELYPCKEKALGISISVKKFQEAFNKHRDAHPQPQQADGRATPSPRDAHKQIPVQVWADIDVGIADAVRYLNTLCGVRTHASCQGTIDEGGAEPYRGHVMASWPARYTEHLQLLFDIALLGENWGYLHSRGVLPSIQQADGRGAVIEAELRSLVKMAAIFDAADAYHDPHTGDYTFDDDVVIANWGFTKIKVEHLRGLQQAISSARAALQQSPATDGPAK